MQKAFARIAKQVSYLEKLSAEKKIDGWLLNANGYQVLFGERNLSFIRSNMLYAVVFLVVLLSGLNAYETQSHMKVNLNSTKYGRGQLRRNKIIFVVSSSVAVMALMGFYELSFINNTYGLSDMGAPIQSLSLFEAFPFQISIGAFLTAMYCVKAVFLTLTGFIIMIISSVSKNHKQGVIYASILLIAPSALLNSGLEIIKPIAVVFYADVMEWVTWIIALGGKT
ncbi:MAG: hypothetical protein FWE59_04245 [Oscillospiraceae bacterium]|nr:hypothetical protein [Oscillospiraceae bacterium]